MDAVQTFFIKIIQIIIFNKKFFSLTDKEKDDVINYETRPHGQTRASIKHQCRPQNFECFANTHLIAGLMSVFHGLDQIITQVSNLKLNHYLFYLFF